MKISHLVATAFATSLLTACSFEMSIGDDDLEPAATQEEVEVAEAAEVSATPADHYAQY